MSKTVKALLLLMPLAVLAGGSVHGQDAARALCNKIGADGPKPGAVAPDFTLASLEGKAITASELWRQRPTVIMTGSHTCPVFRRQVTPFERMAKEFAGKANFLVIYTVEAHPKGDPSPYNGKEWVTPANEKLGLLVAQPKTMNERLERVRQCLSVEKISVPVVVDGMDNKAWKAYGSAPNCACLVGQDGKVILSQPWMEAGGLRAAILTATSSAR